MTQTTGAIRAADRIDKQFLKEHWYSSAESIPEIAAIIEGETHCAEMLAFIEWIGEGNFDKITAQDQAFELIKKVRG